ncbi:hypothetical protein Vlu01_52940 [Micromonospora lutea]|uniref:Uncharacterized protein n=1 Tax=Micromonospora lutea TaxID=419825 RepID=A0ABQ4J3C3_9ACTN|nr:hypothetical protein Vlu01_52940 [Micromonospora lutea]
MGVCHDDQPHPVRVTLRGRDARVHGGRRCLAARDRAVEHGIVRVLPDGSWTPKAAFHALADYGRTRARATTSS